MVDENMSNAARVHAIESGKDVRARTLVAFGGAAPLHAARVAEKLGIDRVLIPANAGVGSAVGFLRAPIAYEIVRSLFNRPDLPPMRLHASASIATVIHMAIEGLGIAVIPTAIVETELAEGRLQLLSTNLQLPLLTFSASWLASPDTVAVERVAELAANLAQGGVIVDAPREARH